MRDSVKKRKAFVTYDYTKADNISPVVETHPVLNKKSYNKKRSFLTFMKSIKSLIFGTVAFASIAVGASASAAEVTHTISAGDTLSTISEKYFGDTDHVQAIADANGISNIHLIFAGEVLKFDDGMLTTSAATTTTTEAAAPVAEETAAVAETPVVEDTTDYTAEAAATTEAATTTVTSTVSGDEASAKEWIAQKESSGSYTATNGQYVGRYQLSSSYLNGDYSAANQEAVADSYVASRYGSWSAAQAFWVANGWY